VKDLQIESRLCAFRELNHRSAIADRFNLIYLCLFDGSPLKNMIKAARWPIESTIYLQPYHHSMIRAFYETMRVHPPQ